MVNSDVAEWRADRRVQVCRNGVHQYCGDDVVRVFLSPFNEVDRSNFMDRPASHHATCRYDRVRLDRLPVGLSHYPVDTLNAAGWTPALLDEEAVSFGTEVSMAWCEPDGGSSKPTVERRIQTEISCMVEPCPKSVTARESYNN